MTPRTNARWIGVVWAAGVVILVVVAAFLLVSGVRAARDAHDARAQTRTVDDSRRSLQQETAALATRVDAAVAEARRIDGTNEPVRTATAAVVGRFLVYLRDVAATNRAEAARIDALNRAVAAQNAGDPAGARSILDGDLQTSTAATTEALARQQQARRAVEASLRALDAVRL